MVRARLELEGGTNAPIVFFLYIAKYASSYVSYLMTTKLGYGEFIKAVTLLSV